MTRASAANATAMPDTGTARHVAFDENAGPISAAISASAGGLANSISQPSLSDEAAAHSLDTDLFALRPFFEAGCERMKAACEAVNRAEDKYGVGNPEHPCLTEAYTAQGVAVDADDDVARKIAAIPARTLQGLLFKREVRQYWKDCERPELDQSIADDACSLQPAIAEAYVAEMRALGVEFTVTTRSGRWALIRGGKVADEAALQEIEARWAVFSDKIDYDVCVYLDEARGFKWAFDLVGNDMAKGLVELRRINDESRIVFADQAAAQDEDSKSETEAAKEAEHAANENSDQYHYLVMHLWQKVPIETFDDVGRKACLAAEHGDYFKDVDLHKEIHQQIAAFFERQQARRWIDGARAAGLSVFPWHGSIHNTNDRGVMTFGQDQDGPNNFSAASDRFRKDPACRAMDGLRKGLVFDVLCEEFEVDPADPAMCDKVNAKLKALAETKSAALTKTRGKPAVDRDLIRLCKKTIEALKADLAAGTVKMDAEEAFRQVKPTYPVLPNGWRYAPTETSAADLREAIKRGRPNASRAWLADMRAQLTAVVEWEREKTDLRRSVGLRAAEIRENRTTDRISNLMEQVVATPARTVYGIACKATIIEHWLRDGYDLSVGSEGNNLVLSILDEIRHLGTEQPKVTEPRRAAA